MVTDRRCLRTISTAFFKERLVGRLIPTVDQREGRSVVTVLKGIRNANGRRNPIRMAEFNMLNFVGISKKGRPTTIKANKTRKTGTHGSSAGIITIVARMIRAGRKKMARIHISVRGVSSYTAKSM